MAQLNDYPQIIKQILTQHIDRCNQNPDPERETFLVIDPERGHYIWMSLGWQNGERFSGATVYVRIRDGKFWVEEDWTEDGIANELLTAGVPKEHIVLAFHEPELRAETGFALA
ncbi:MAG: XisI protein [Spirulina sp. SIO3F2]|nr:XisI protein [Spirulina sp. SIO3F2]